MQNIQLGKNTSIDDGALHQVEPNDTPGHATLTFDADTVGHNRLWALTTIPTYSKSSYYGHKRARRGSLAPSMAHRLMED